MLTLRLTLTGRRWRRQNECTAAATFDYCHHSRHSLFRCKRERRVEFERRAVVVLAAAATMSAAAAETPRSCCEILLTSQSPETQRKARHHVADMSI